MDEKDIERIVSDCLMTTEHRLEEINSTLSDIESALGWLVKRAREEDNEMA